MSLFSSSGLSLLSAFTDDGQKLSRAQKIHRENERSNLLTISRLVLRSFIEQAMTACNRIIECDTQQLSDLLMMLEKVLWHGFKATGQKSLFVLKTPDAELWLSLCRIARTDESMWETVTCIDQLEQLITPIAKLRAFLRLAMMQKKLADFFTFISQSPLLKDFYEVWALIRQEDVIQLTGALLGLTVVDCNLALDHDHLQDQPLSVDLAFYIRLPTVAIDAENGTTNNKTEIKTALEGERRKLLDQNNYLEERNRQLQLNVDNMKKRLDSVDSDRSSLVTMEHEMVSFRNVDEDRPVPSKGNLEKAWNEERERLLGQIVEREDSLRIAQQQISDTKKINGDLYDKLRISEESIRKLERDFLRLREGGSQEKDNLTRRISEQEAQLCSLTERLSTRDTADDSIRHEFDRKCEQYTQTLSKLENCQQELSQATTEMEAMRRRISSMELELKELPFVVEELKELKTKYEVVSKRANESERALEELGGHLSESKLRMVELAEELLPLTEAQWADDSDINQCTSCEEKFSIAKRKHHCRMCGLIFCAMCSEGKVKLPSNSKPARVCNNCFVVLKARQSDK